MKPRAAPWNARAIAAGAALSVVCGVVSYVAGCLDITRIPADPSCFDETQTHVVPCPADASDEGDASSDAGAAVDADGGDAAGD